MSKNKLPKILVTSKQKKEYYTKDAYLCTCDREHRMVHEFEGEGGEKFTLFLPKDKSNDHREKHPNIGKIAYAPEGSQFKEGDELLCRHFTFELDDNTARVFYERDGEEYYKVINQDIMFGIRDGELIPREGVLLCEGIEDKLYHTTLELLASDIDVRR